MTDDASHAHAPEAAPDAGRAGLDRAESLTAAGRIEEAGAVLLDLQAASPGWAPPYFAQAELVLAHRLPADVGGLIQTLLRRFPAKPRTAKVVERLAAAHRSSAREAAMALTPELAAHPIVARLACEKLLEDGELARARDAALAGLSPGRVTESHLILAEQLFQLGMRADVVAWMEDLRARPDAFETEDLRARFEAFVARQPDTRAVVTYPGPEGAKATLFVFCGLHNRPGVEEADLADWVRDLPVHVVVLRDPKLLMYLKGVPGLGDDFVSTAAALKAMAGDLGGGEVLVFGNSAGGYAALRFGDQMNADRVLCFSALTTMTEASMRADGRAGAVAERLLMEVPDLLVDMREVLMARPDPLRVHLYYGAEMAVDAGYAERMADVPGVILHPAAGQAAHGLVQRLAGTGEARGILRDFVMGRL